MPHERCRASSCLFALLALAAAAACSGGGGDADRIPDDSDDDDVSPRVWAALAGGGSHTCAIDPDGVTWCWGDNGNGQLGDGSFAPSSAPVKVAWTKKAVALAAGWVHTCAIDDAGGAWCWGWNDLGTLGDGTTEGANVPVPVQGLTSVRAMACGDSHTCAVTASGAAYCWGLNEFGQLGNGGAPTDEVVPTQVVGLSGATSIAAGFMHTCASTSGGEVYCWGTNDYGEVGPNGATDTFIDPNDTPLLVPGVAGAAEVVAGDGFSCARTSGLEVWCWGENAQGQLGAGGGESPARVIELGQAREVVAGTQHLCVRGNDDLVRCLGRDDEGQLGGAPSLSGAASPEGVGPAQRLGAGDQHTCAASKAGDVVWCWGANADGQLGRGTSAPSAAPAHVAW